MISIQDVVEFFKTENPNKSESTYNTMRFNIIRLQKIHDKDINDLSIDDFINIKKNMKLLNEKYSLNTIIQTLMGIKLFLRFKEVKTDLPNSYNDELKKLCASKQEVIEKNEMTE